MGRRAASADPAAFDPQLTCGAAGRLGGGQVDDEIELGRDVEELLASPGIFIGIFLLAVMSFIYRRYDLTGSLIFPSFRPRSLPRTSRIFTSALESL